MPTALRAVLFDAVGTLVHPAPSVEEIYRTAALEFGLDLPSTEIRQRFRRAFAAQDDRDRREFGLRTSESREHDRWRAIVAEVFSELADTGRLFEQLWTRFGSARYWQVFDDVPQALDALAARDLILGTASNFDGRLFSLCRELPQLARLAHVFVSSEIGWRKPAPEFFAAIAERLGCHANELLLICDDQETDVRGATAAGWQAIWLDRTDECAPGKNPSIASLAALLGRIDHLAGDSVAPAVDR